MSATVVPIDTSFWKISTVLPAAPAVPLSVSVVSLVRWSPAVPLSTENAVIGGATGATVSMVTRNVVAYAPWLPAASVALAVSAWVPSPSTEVVIVNAPPVATPVPSTVVPSVSYSVTVLPASAVPPIVSVASFEKPLSATVPVTGSTSSVTDVIAGAAGAEVSMVTWYAVEAAPWLPAVSVALAVMVWLPWPSAVVVIENAPPVATPLPSTVVPSVSYSVTVLPASAVPAIVSVASFEEPLSATVPVTGSTSSVTDVIAGAAGAVASMVTWYAVEAAPWLPAVSVALAVMVWLPWPSAVVVIENAPPVATPLPSTVVPSVSYSVTVLPASAVPAIVSVASFEEPLSASVPVTGSTSSVTDVIAGAAGAVALMVTWYAVEAAPWLPAVSVALAVMVWLPWPSAVVVIENAPPVATPLPSTVVPSVSYSVTVLPASAVPAIVSVASFEEPLSASVPVTGSTSSVTDVIAGAAGAVALMVTWYAVEAAPWLPAVSVALAVMVWLPWPSAVVVIENAPPLATPVPSTVVPSVSYSVTVLPASAVPAIVSVASFEEPLSASVPVTGSTSSVTDVIAGAAGAVALMVTWYAVEAAPWLPAVSVALAVMVWLPWPSAVVVIENAPPVATPLPSTVVPSVSYSVTVLPASAVPAIVSVASFEEPLSASVPVTGSTSSVTDVIAGAAGAVALMVTWYAVEAAPWLPAVSVALAVMVWLPWPSAVVVIENAPPLATPVPSTVVPSVSYSVTVLPASAVPAIVSVASFEEPLSASVPVTGSTSSVTDVIAGAAGAVALMVTWYAVEAAPWLPAVSVALAVMVWLPWPSAVVVIENAPPVATPLPSTVVPSVSYSVTVLPASAVPAIVSVASFEEPLSATVPVTGSTSSVTDVIAGAAGAVASMVTWYAVEAAPWLPAVSVALA